MFLFIFFNFILVCFVFLANKVSNTQCFSGDLTYECQTSATAACLRLKEDSALFSVEDFGSMRAEWESPNVENH